MGQRLVDAFVGVLKVDVLADDGDLDALLGADNPLHKTLPVRHIRRRRRDAEELAGDLVQFFLLQLERQLIDV